MTQPTTVQVQGPVVVMPLEDYNNIQTQLNELRTKIEDFEDILDMLLILQADEDEAIDYEKYRQPISAGWMQR
jgi:hypothetical protein